jgi:hypothetical protein
MCAYLNNTSITSDAILTKIGRSKLAQGRNSFKITKFALGDSEIDYTLWNVAHPMGTDYYGIAIESLPILEAVPDESQMMKSKLVTLSKNSTRIPVITVSATNIELTAPGDVSTITPNTSNFEKGNSTLGYTAILSNSDIAYIQPSAGKEIPSSIISAPIQDNASPTSVSVAGFAFDVIAKNQPYEDKIATVTIIGNETGGRQVVNVTVKKSEVATVNTSTL